MVLNSRSACELSAIALAVGFSALAGAQGPVPPSANAVLSEKESNGITFSIDDAKEINQHLRWQDIAVSESRRILELRLDGKLMIPADGRPMRQQNSSGGCAYPIKTCPIYYARI